VLLHDEEDDDNYDYEDEDDDVEEGVKFHSSPNGVERTMRRKRGSSSSMKTNRLVLQLLSFLTLI